MAVRNCAEIGENLQKIVTRLMANDELVNLLYFNDSDINSIDKDNAINVNDINNNFEYVQSQQQTQYGQENTEQNNQEFDYTLLKVIVFLIFI